MKTKKSSKSWLEKAVIYILPAIILIGAAAIIVADRAGYLEQAGKIAPDSEASTVKGVSQAAKPMSAEALKKAAAKFAQKKEKPGTGITIRYNDSFYNFVPFEINGTINSTFPGLMLDSQGQPVNDEFTLKRLFEYPALVKRFSYNTAKFDDLAAKKVTAVSKYCDVISKQEIKLGAIHVEGTIVGVIYDASKLAYDAGTLVAGGAIKSLYSLGKDLAKSKVQDSIVSYFSSADTLYVRENAKQAYEAAFKSSRACRAALAAWRAAQSLSGKVSPDFSQSATIDLFRTFLYEAQAIDYLRQALLRVNEYPKAVTKINKKNYQASISGLVSLVKKLEKERDYWKQENENAIEFIDDWVQEHLDRAPPPEPVVPEPAPVPAPPAPAETQVVTPPVSNEPSCSAVDLASDSTLYNYSHQSGPCANYQQSVTASSLSFKCQSASASWRGYWVKEISTLGASKLKISADLGLIDHSRFFTECSGVGVKYDNYVDLKVLADNPNPALSAECNRTVSAADWPKCSVSNTGDNVLGHCGVLKCSASQKCDLNVNTAGRDKVYLVFHTSDAWLAGIEGKMSNLSVCKISSISF